VPSVTAAVEDVAVALDTVAELVSAGWLEALSEAELLAVTSRLQVIVSRAQALADASVAEVRDGEAAACAGFASTSSWLEARTGLSKGQSRSAVALGEKLQWEFDATRIAWVAGEISEGAVRAITDLIPKKLKGVSDVDYVAARTELEAMTLHPARTRTVAEVRRAIERAAIVVDPAGADAVALAATASEFLSFTPVADGMEIHGFLVKVHAEDYAAGLGGDILLPGFGRVPVPNTTIDRILCDSEVHPVLTRRGHGPRSSSPDPAQHPGSAPRSTDPPWRPPMRPRPGGGWEYAIDPVPEPTVEALETDTDLAVVTEFSDDLDDHDSWWSRFLGEPARHVLDVGHSFRLAPPKLRRALTLRDGGCVVPGCTADPSRCEAHHITYWEHSGETSISTMVLLCSKHHHMVHKGRWHITRNGDLDPGHPDYVTLTSPAPRP